MSGINGGIGGGPDYQRPVLFYLGVPHVEAALQRAKSPGGRRLTGPEPESGAFTVGHLLDPEGNLLDPEGNLVGVAGPSA